MNDPDRGDWPGGQARGTGHVTKKLDGDAARVLAARLGVELDEPAARDAAQSMAGLLEAADAHMRAIPFEAEPGSYPAAQRRSRR